MTEQDTRSPGFADAPTVLDPGRLRCGSEPVTVLDPGRTPIAAGEARLLPVALTDRFEVVRELTGSGRQGDVFLVRIRDTGEQRVLKVHRTGRLDERVLAYLGQQHSRHVVTVHETGVAEDRQYEVMEYLAGGALSDWRDRHPYGVDADVVTELVRQLAEGLVELHSYEVVHRDLKPSNVLVRSLQPLELVIADLGISRQVDEGGMYVKDRPGTPPYMPPEYNTGRDGRLSSAHDWWSLGITVLELAIGRAVFHGIGDEAVIQEAVSTRPIAVDAVSDDRLRRLCAGLLVRDPEDRWGAEQVNAWLRGESPPVAAVPAAGESAVMAKEPYVYLGVEYWARDLLAAAMTANWNVSRSVLFGDDAGPRTRLRAWLEQFPGMPATRRPPRRETDDVKLLYQLRDLDPTYPPWYRGLNVTPARLPELANEGTEGGVAADIVTDLWRAELLPVLAEGAAAGGIGGGDGLREVQSRWRVEDERLRTLADAVPDTAARTELRRILRGEHAYVRSLTLLAATAAAVQLREVQQQLNERDRTFVLPWFSQLVADQQFQWVAVALSRHASREADRLAEQERVRRASEAWLRRTERQREWSRRQNRPQALGYTAAGVAVLAVLLFMLVGLSDVAGVASDARIVDAWFAVVASLAVVMLSESLLAWSAGGRFHPAYSLLGAGAIVLGRVARSLIVQRIAVPAVLIALAGLGTVVIVWPVIAPCALAGLLVAWSVQRYFAWREQDRRERAIVAAA